MELPENFAVSSYFTDATLACPRCQGEPLGDFFDDLKNVTGDIATGAGALNQIFGGGGTPQPPKLNTVAVVGITLAVVLGGYGAYRVIRG